jgi:hypothetical protein
VDGLVFPPTSKIFICQNPGVQRRLCANNLLGLASFLLTFPGLLFILPIGLEVGIVYRTANLFLHGSFYLVSFAFDLVFGTLFHGETSFAAMRCTFTAEDRRLPLVFILRQQKDAAHNDNGSSERAIWDMVRGFFGRMNRPYVQNCVACLESERAPDYDCKSDHNQDNRRCFH